MNTTYSKDYPEHDRTSCNDENLNNADPNGTGCDRCTALLFDRYFALKKEVQVLRKDAERWRAFRKAAVSGDEDFFMVFAGIDTGHAAASEEAFDASVDAAMKEQA